MLFPISRSATRPGIQPPASSSSTPCVLSPQPPRVSNARSQIDLSFAMPSEDLSSFSASPQLATIPLHPGAGKDLEERGRAALVKRRAEAQEAAGDARESKKARWDIILDGGSRGGFGAELGKNPAEYFFERPAREDGEGRRHTGRGVGCD